MDHSLEQIESDGIGRPICSRLLVEQAVEPISCWRIYYQRPGGPIVARSGEDVAPVHRRDAAGVLLEREPGRRRGPGDGDCARRDEADGQHRGAGGLHLECADVAAIATAGINDAGKIKWPQRSALIGGLAGAALVNGRTASEQRMGEC